jgi:hypothetical protein
VFCCAERGDSLNLKAFQSRVAFLDTKKQQSTNFVEWDPSLFHPVVQRSGADSIATFNQSSSDQGFAPGVGFHLCGRSLVFAKKAIQNNVVEMCVYPWRFVGNVANLLPV